MCKWCLEDKEESDFYPYRKNVCKACMVEYNKAYKTPYIPPEVLKPAKGYKDYLREAGMTEYCKRYLKNFT